MDAIKRVPLLQQSTSKYPFVSLYTILLYIISRFYQRDIVQHACLKQFVFQKFYHRHSPLQPVKEKREGENKKATKFVL